MRDVRRIVGGRCDLGLRDLVKYYRENFPALIKK